MYDSVSPRLLREALQPGAETGLRRGRERLALVGARRARGWLPVGAGGVRRASSPGGAAACPSESPGLSGCGGGSSALGVVRESGAVTTEMKVVLLSCEVSWGS